MNRFSGIAIVLVASLAACGGGNVVPANSLSAQGAASQQAGIAPQPYATVPCLELAPRKGPIAAVPCPSTRPTSTPSPTNPSPRPGCGWVWIDGHLYPKPC